MKKNIVKQTVLALSILFVLTACGGDGKNGAPSSDNLLSDDHINTKPVADAGDNKDVTESILVTLDGSRSYDVDDDSLTYQWTLLEKPKGSAATLSDNTSQQPTLQVDKDGHYKIQLIVNDGKEASDADFVFITLNVPPPPPPPPPTAPTPVTPNHAPEAKISGSLFEIVSGDATINLNGAESSDPDGDSITYYWSLVKKPSGYNTPLGSINSSTSSININVEGIYRVVLMVNDGKEWSPSASKYILYKKPEPDNVAPTAVPVISQSIVMVHPDKETDVIMDGSFSKDDGIKAPLSYEWKNKGGVLTEYARAKLTFSCADDWQLCYGDDQQKPVCSYTNTLTVNDGEFSNHNTVDVSVDYSHCNTPPVVEPPIAVAKTLGCSGPGTNTENEYLRGLDGRASSGDNLTYTWSVELDGSLDDTKRSVAQDELPDGEARFRVKADASGIEVSAIMIKLTVKNSAGESSTFASPFPAICPEHP